jgi:hypothetical protein
MHYYFSQKMLLSTNVLANQLATDESLMCKRLSKLPFFIRHILATKVSVTRIYDVNKVSVNGTVPTLYERIKTSGVKNKTRRPTVGFL